MNYLLDTNLLLIHARGNWKTKEFLSELGLFDENRLLMSIISMGECRTIMGEMIGENEKSTNFMLCLKG